MVFQATSKELKPLLVHCKRCAGVEYGHLNVDCSRYARCFECSSHLSVKANSDVFPGVDASMSSHLGLLILVPKHLVSLLLLVSVNHVDM